MASMEDVAQRQATESHELTQGSLAAEFSAVVKVGPYAGFVIGRKGATIRAIGVETGTYCAVDDSVPGDEVANISGPSQEAVDAAVAKVQEVMAMAAEKGPRTDAQYSESLPITRFQAARVIGRGGERVRGIESTTGARIRIISRHGDQRVVVEAPTPAAGESALEQVKAAIAEADAAGSAESSGKRWRGGREGARGAGGVHHGRPRHSDYRDNDGGYDDYPRGDRSYRQHEAGGAYECGYAQAPPLPRGPPPRAHGRGGRGMGGYSQESYPGPSHYAGAGPAAPAYPQHPGGGRGHPGARSFGAPSMAGGMPHGSLAPSAGLGFPGMPTAAFGYQGAAAASAPSYYGYPHAFMSGAGMESAAMAFPGPAGYDPRTMAPYGMAYPGTYSPSGSPPSAESAMGGLPPGTVGLH